MPRPSPAEAAPATNPVWPEEQHCVQLCSHGFPLGTSSFQGHRRSQWTRREVFLNGCDGGCQHKGLDMYFRCSEAAPVPKKPFVESLVAAILSVWITILSISLNHDLFQAILNL